MARPERSPVMQINLERIENGFVVHTENPQDSKPRQLTFAATPNEIGEVVRAATVKWAETVFADS